MSPPVSVSVERALRACSRRAWSAGAAPAAALLLRGAHAPRRPSAWTFVVERTVRPSLHGDRELAIKNQKKSLKLNPRNSGATAALAKLKTEN